MTGHYIQSNLDQNIEFLKQNQKFKSVCAWIKLAGWFGWIDGAPTNYSLNLTAPLPPPLRRARRQWKTRGTGGARRQPEKGGAAVTNNAFFAD